MDRVSRSVRAARVAGLVSLWLVVGAVPARAAFPGRDGDLVVATGTGLELVAPGTAAATPICTDAVLCGHPAQPAVSPNGRAIAFVDTTTGRPVVIAADGSCLWCLMGAPLTRRTGSEPAFTPGGQGVTVAGNGLWSVSLTGGRARRLLNGRVDGAMWSSRGLVAVVRGGWIWVGRPGHGKLRRLARGGSPSFSPDASRLALARGGYVWIARVGGGRERRLVRGGAPAWSPDGLQIAYIGAGGAVEMITVDGGRPRHVGSVRGTALDWQPVTPSAKPGCKPPGGAVVVASDSQAVVFSPRRSEHVYGCLTALGRPQLLLNASRAYPPFDGVIAVRLAGRFAMLEPDYENQYGQGNKEVTLYDLSTGTATRLARVSYDLGLEAPDRAELIGGGVRAGVGSTAGPIVYVRGFDSLALDSSGFAAWRKTSTPMPPAPNLITALSCQSASLCIAGDDVGNILSSTNPTGGPTAWSIAPVLPQETIVGWISGVSCPSSLLCVAVDSAGDVLTSTDPTGGVGSWTTRPVQGGYWHISCPSVSLCVAGGVAGGGVNHVGGAAAILTSTEPTGGASAWTSAQVAPNDAIVALSCPSVSLCVATTSQGEVLTSTDPTGGASAWTKTAVDPGGDLPALSCPSVSLCVAADVDYTKGSPGNAPSPTRAGDILITTNPTGGASAWSKAAIDPGDDLSAVSCPSVSLCVATTYGGQLLTSTDPAGGASVWTKAPAGINGAVACPSISLCVAVGGPGDVVTSPDPTGGANTWTSAPIDVPPGCPQTLAPCASESLFVHDDQGTRVIDTAPPGPINSINNVTLAGDSQLLTWTHDGAQRQLQMR
jgi:hypothetical protein